MHASTTSQHALTQPRLPGEVKEVGYESMTVTKVPDWYGMIAWDALLNGMAAAVSELAAPAVFKPVAKVAYPVALVLLLVDLTMLVFDLGDPLRFHHMLRVFKPHSPVGGDVVSDDLLALADRRGGAQRAGRTGAGLRVGAHTCGDLGTAARLRLRSL